MLRKPYLPLRKTPANPLIPNPQNPDARSPIPNPKLHLHFALCHFQFALTHFPFPATSPFPNYICTLHFAIFNLHKPISHFYQPPPIPKPQSLLQQGRIPPYVGSGFPLQVLGALRDASGLSATIPCAAVMSPVQRSLLLLPKSITSIYTTYYHSPFPDAQPPSTTNPFPILLFLIRIQPPSFLLLSLTAHPANHTQPPHYPAFPKTSTPFHTHQTTIHIL